MAHEQALAFLDQAIQLHEGHMSGSVPTSEESQEELMGLLEQARESLGSYDEGGGDEGGGGMMGGGMGMGMMGGSAGEASMGAKSMAKGLTRASRRMPMQG